MTYGSANSKVTENGTASLVGNRVAGVPKYTSTVSATWKPLAQWAATVTYRKVGSYAVDAANTVTYGGYNTWDLGLSYTARGSQNYRVYVQVANLADKAYATTASVIGGTRLYAPGAPRTLSAGVQYQF
jgi:outer membrane receptor protein involved in Fe transport